MSVDAELLAIIDSRIAAYLKPQVMMGTVEARDPTGSLATVRFDGDDTGVPVKVDAGVHVFPPDRVLMQRVIGSGQKQPDVRDPRKPSPGEWVVVAGFTRHTGPGGYVSARGVMVNDNVNVTSFTDMVDVPVLPFTKRYTDTRVNLNSNMGCFSNTVGAAVEFALQINGVDYPVGEYQWSVGMHVPVGGFNTTPGGIPAGDYNIVARWRRIPTGAIGINNADWYNISAEETGP